MLLVIDVGNTNITAAIYNGSSLLDTFRCLSDFKLPISYYRTFLKKISDNYLIKDCVIGSVVGELNEIISQATLNTFHLSPVIINSHSKLNIKVNCEKPYEVGIDRIANASAVTLKYSLPAIVVDLGTATTFEVISKEKELLGGIIMPGLNLQLEALSSKTSALHKIQISDSERAIGNNTKSSILSGVVRGSASAIDGLIEQCEQELGINATVIATGGYSSFIANYMKRKFDFIDPTLTLDGLKHLYEINSCVYI